MQIVRRCDDDEVDAIRAARFLERHRGVRLIAAVQVPRRGALLCRLWIRRHGTRHDEGLPVQFRRDAMDGSDERTSAAADDPSAQAPPVQSLLMMVSLLTRYDL